MRLGRSSAGRHERAVAELEERRTQVAAELERAEAAESAAKGRTAELQELDTRRFLNEVSAEDADAARREIDDSIRGASETTASLRRVAAGLDERIAGARRELQKASFEAAVAEVKQAGEAAATASESFAKQLVALTGAGDELTAARERTKAAEAQARELRPADDDTDVSALVVDEPDWAKVDPPLIEFLQAGPRQPIAKGRVASQEQDRQRASRIRATYQEAIRWGSRQGKSGAELHLRQLPDDLREQAESEIEEKYAAAVARHYELAEKRR